jgi:hypothetical protein
MNFMTRAAIALLTGVGSGLIGFYAMWQLVWATAGEHPGIGHDAWLVAAIFVPGVLVPLTVFRAISRKAAPVTA